MNSFIKPKQKYIPVRVVADYRPHFNAIRVKTLGKEEEWVVKPEEVFTEDQVNAERKKKEDDLVRSKNIPLLNAWERGIRDTKQLAEACCLPVVAVWMKLKALQRRGIITGITQ